MSSIAETSGANNSPIVGPLAAGVNTISSTQTITFTKYVLVVLPLDGYNFWVNATIVAPPLNPNQWNLSNPVVQVQGSLHYSSDQQQNETDNPAINSVIFTSLTEIEEFNDISPTTIYIGEWEGVRFAFNQRFKYYQQSGLHHYRGNAIYPVMESLIIDNLNQLDLNALIVSNSLPIWLALNAKGAVYPSFAVPANLRPPYISAHIEPTGTKAFQSSPFVDTTGSSWQLATETVRFVLYGYTSDQAHDWLTYVLDASMPDYAAWGSMNIPIIQDDKRTQTELSILAERKTVTLEVNYYQARIKAISMQLIESAIISVTPTTTPA